MKMRAVWLIMALVLILSGCQAWQATKDIYKGYVLPAEVDIQAEADVEEEVKQMAHSLTPVDQRLEELHRSIRRFDDPSSQQLRALFSAHPWLNGAMVLTPSGKVQSRLPAHPIKQVSPEALLDRGGASLNGEYLAVQQTDLGPELSLLKPIRNGGDISAYVLAHFDPRSLVSQSPSPDSILMVHKGQVLWSEIESSIKSQVGQLDWEQKLADQVQGVFTLEGTRFGWLARYVGHSPLVYVVRIASNGSTG